MHLDDYVEVLSCLWCSNKMSFSSEGLRITLWRFEHFAGYTSTRPGGLVDGSRGPDIAPVDEFDSGASDPPVLRYRDCSLTLLPNPVAGQRDVWVLEIQMNRTKNGLALVKPYDETPSISLPR